MSRAYNTLTHRVLYVILNFVSASKHCHLNTPQLTYRSCVTLTTKSDYAVLRSVSPSKQSIPCFPSAVRFATLIRRFRFSISQRMVSACPVNSRANSMSAFARFIACAAKSKLVSSICPSARSDNSKSCSGEGSEFTGRYLSAGQNHFCWYVTDKAIQIFA